MFDFVTGPAEHMCFSLQRELAIARIDPAPFEVIQLRGNSTSFYFHAFCITKSSKNF